MDTNSFIEKATIVHNNLYNYDKVIYRKSIEKVIITCPIHGDFKQTPNNHINNKQRCPNCYGTHKYTTEEFIKICTLVHNNKFNYDLVEYENNKCKIKIICPIHGIFEQKSCHHLSGKDCINCAAIKTANNKKYSTTQFIEKATTVHNNFYNYDKVIYKKSTEKVIITCPIHGDFKQGPSAHINKQGCPKCVNTQRSKGNKIISDFLIENNIEYITEKRFLNCKNKKPLPFDFYIPTHNLCIEFDGIQHFKPIPMWGGEEGLKKRNTNDNIKTLFCENNNINLLRIRYDDDIIFILYNYFK